MKPVIVSTTGVHFLSRQDNRPPCSLSWVHFQKINHYYYIDIFFRQNFRLRYFFIKKILCVTCIHLVFQKGTDFNLYFKVTRSTH